MKSDNKDLKMKHLFFQHIKEMKHTIFNILYAKETKSNSLEYDIVCVGGQVTTNQTRWHHIPELYNLFTNSYLAIILKCKVVPLLN
jgi:hypothetical protein